jgi:hypothetical protein
MRNSIKIRNSLGISYDYDFLRVREIRMSHFICSDRLCKEKSYIWKREGRLTMVVDSVSVLG